MRSRNRRPVLPAVTVPSRVEPSDTLTVLPAPAVRFTIGVVSPVIWFDALTPLSGLMLVNTGAPGAVVSMPSVDEDQAGPVPLPLRPGLRIAHEKTPAECAGVSKPNLPRGLRLVVDGKVVELELLDTLGFDDLVAKVHGDSAIRTVIEADTRRLGGKSVEPQRVDAQAAIDRVRPGSGILVDVEGVDARAAGCGDARAVDLERVVPAPTEQRVVMAADAGKQRVAAITTVDEVVTACAGIGQNIVAQTAAHGVVVGVKALRQVVHQAQRVVADATVKRVAVAIRRKRVVPVACREDVVVTIGGQSVRARARQHGVEGAAEAGREQVVAVAGIQRVMEARRRQSVS